MNETFIKQAGIGSFFKSKGDEAASALIKSLKDPNAKKALKGYRRQANDNGLDSITTMLPNWAAKKIFGEKKVNDLVWNKIHRPALSLDTTVGAGLQKIPFAKKLFTSEDTIPWNKSGDLLKKVERASALAPISKARNIAAPIVLGVAMEKGLDKAINVARQREQMNKQAHEKALLEKAASVMSALHERNKGHEKIAHATKLLYKKAEMGLDIVPSNYSQLQEKLGELLTQDLFVLEKALELSGGHIKLGELGPDSDVYVGTNAESKFQAGILGSIEDY